MTNKDQDHTADSGGQNFDKRFRDEWIPEAGSHHYWHRVLSDPHDEVQPHPRTTLFHAAHCGASGAHGRLELTLVGLPLLAERGQSVVRENQPAQR